MAGINFNDNQLKSNDSLSLDALTEEFQNYLNRSGVTDSLMKVLQLIYDMDEKPIDPLEFMRTHMTDVIPEKVELTKLEDELTIVRQQIVALEKENVDVINKLKELELNDANELKNENNTLSGTSVDREHSLLNNY